MLGADVTVKRAVTNVGPAAQYSASWEVPDGINVSVSPTVLSLGAGETGEFEVRFTSTGAELLQWHSGSITWQSTQHRVRSPFVVRPWPLDAPERISATGASGALQLPIQFFFDGPYFPRVHGLQLPCILPGGDHRRW